MDELDKKVAPEEGAELCAPEGAAISETCVENESPAEALSEATDELQHFLNLGAALLRAEGPLSEEAAEALIFKLADELEEHLRAMSDQQGAAGIGDLRAWTRAWIDERRKAYPEESLPGEENAQ